MRNYELLYIVPNQFTDDEAKRIQGKVNAMLEKQGAVLGFQEFLGKKKLAYPIKKVQHGYYIVVEFELEDGPKIAVITNDLNLDKEVLRAQIIEKHKITEKEIARQNKMREMHPEVEEAGIDSPKPRRKFEDKPVTKAKEDDKDSKKVGIENLDEKLDEMLGDDSVV